MAQMELSVSQQQWPVKVEKYGHPFPATLQALGPREDFCGFSFEGINAACSGTAYLWCPGLHCSGGTVPKETNVSAKQLVS